jgi:hypothetical protein
MNSERKPINVQKDFSAPYIALKFTSLDFFINVASSTHYSIVLHVYKVLSAGH